jgi:hypothetical protein
VIEPDPTDTAGPKKLLALDGGGIRGIIALCFLSELERQLRDELGADDDFVLADYFDFIGGTSTGAIIAAGLALGLPVRDLQQLYGSMGSRMFRRRLLPLRFWSLFRRGPLTRELQQLFGADLTFGDNQLQTLLLIVLKNASTDSPWPLSNAPGAHYNARARPDCNLTIPLWKLVRASTAAPFFFPAEKIEVGSHTFLFVDGGVTTYNNPGFQLFLSAAMPEYGVGWPTGEKRLLLVSVGTGSAPTRELRGWWRHNAITNLRTVTTGTLFAMSNQQDLLCRALGRTVYGTRIDSEVGDLVGDHGLESKLFTYVRYNVELSRDGLAQLGLGDIDPEKVAKLASVAHANDLAKIGSRAAMRDVAVPQHLADFLAVRR